MEQFILKNRNFAVPALTTSYGIGRVTAVKLLGVILLNPKASYRTLEKKLFLILPYVFKLKIEFRLRVATFSDMLQKMKNKTYSGIRMLQHSPVRGQRTKTNGNTPKNQHKKGVFFPFAIKRIVKDNPSAKSKKRKTTGIKQ